MEFEKCAYNDGFLKLDILRQKKSCVSYYVLR